MILFEGFETNDFYLNVCECSSRVMRKSTHVITSVAMII